MLQVIDFVINLYWVGKITLASNLIVIIMQVYLLFVSGSHLSGDAVMVSIKDLMLSLTLFWACLFWYIGNLQVVFDEAAIDNTYVQASNILYLVFEPGVGVLNTFTVIVMIIKYNNKDKNRDRND